MYTHKDMEGKGFETVYSHGNYTNNKTALLYMRDNGEGRRAVEAKADDVRAWARKRGFEIIKLFVDGPESDPYRNELSEAIRNIKRDRIPVLIVNEDPDLGRYDNTIGYINSLVEKSGAWVCKRR